MGIQWNLCDKLGAPKHVKCPDCGRMIETMFDDYDIDVGGWNPEPGVFILDCYCVECECEWSLKYRVCLEQ